MDNLNRILNLLSFAPILMQAILVLNCSQYFFGIYFILMLYELNIISVAIISPPHWTFQLQKINEENYIIITEVTAM